MGGHGSSRPATTRSASVETRTPAPPLVAAPVAILRLVRPNLPIFVAATTHTFSALVLPASCVCLRTDCTIPERDPCVSKQQLHFEPGRPFSLSPMTAVASFGVPEAWWRMRQRSETALDPLRSLSPIDTYVSHSTVVLSCYSTAFLFHHIQPALHSPSHKAYRVAHNSCFHLLQTIGRPTLIDRDHQSSHPSLATHHGSLGILDGHQTSPFQRLI
jgi:hypothetical protein